MSTRASSGQGVGAVGRVCVPRALPSIDGFGAPHACCVAPRTSRGGAAGGAPLWGSVLPPVFLGADHRSRQGGSPTV